MRVVGIILLLVVSGTASAVESITLHALFKDKAIVIIDGKRRVLTLDGASPEGVRLLSTDTVAEQAEIQADGKRQTLKLGTVIAGFSSAALGSVTLYAESNGHFLADGTINGKSVRFLVDTGATTIALSSATADRLGLDYKKPGQAGYATTAGGMVRMYRVTLNNVQVGDILLYNIAAGVIEGDFPIDPLLGMSFLGKLDMKRDADKMELKQRY